MAPRGRPKPTAEAKHFRKSIAQELNRVIGIPELGLTVKQAAKDLGVSRQCFYQYLAGRTTPDFGTIARAIDLWGIKPVYEGQEISRRAFGAAPGVISLPPTTTQLSLIDLFEVPQECHNDNLKVVLRRTRDSSLQVTIKMKKVNDTTRRPHRESKLA